MPVTTRSMYRKKPENAWMFPKVAQPKVVQPKVAQPKVDTKAQVSNKLIPVCETFIWFKSYAMKMLETMQTLVQRRRNLRKQINNQPKSSPRIKKLLNERSDIFRDQLRVVFELYSNISIYCPVMKFTGPSMLKLFNVMIDKANELALQVFKDINLLDLKNLEDRVLLDNVMGELANGEKILYILVLENENKISSERSRRHSVRQYYVGMDTNEPDYTYNRYIDIWEQLNSWKDPGYNPEDDEDYSDEDDEDYVDDDNDENEQEFADQDETEDEEEFADQDETEDEEEFADQDDTEDDEEQYAQEDDEKDYGWSCLN
jgi:hypothetical protein